MRAQFQVHGGRQPIGQPCPYHVMSQTKTSLVRVTEAACSSRRWVLRCQSQRSYISLSNETRLVSQKVIHELLASYGVETGLRQPLKQNLRPSMLLNGPPKFTAGQRASKTVKKSRHYHFTCSTTTMRRQLHLRTNEEPDKCNYEYI